MNLTATDRCDRCNARAVVQLLGSNNRPLELMFCRHHYLENSDALTRQQWEVNDYNPSVLTIVDREKAAA